MARIKEGLSGESSRRHKAAENFESTSTATKTSAMEFSISPDERKELLDRLARMIYEGCREDLELLSPAQLYGLLDVSHKTLWTLTDIPRVTVIPNKVIRYRLSDVKAWLASRRA